LRVVLPEEMARIDREAINREGIPGLDLMERAGEAVARAARDMLSSGGGRKVAILCGKGNNAGDGLVAARRLSGAFTVVVYMVGVGSAGDLSEDSRSNMDRIKDTTVAVEWIRAEDDGEILRAELPAFDIVVDALFGTGFAGVATGLYADAIDAVNESGRQVLAVDIPSGVAGATGAVAGTAVIAERTITFAAPKVGLVQFPGAGHAGWMEVADIGIPASLLDSVPESHIYLTTEEDADALLPLRAADSLQGSCGRVLVAGGSVGMTGAPAMASQAALRSGAGLVTLAVPEGLNDILEVKLTEIMTAPLPEGPGRSFSPGSAAEVLRLAGDFDVVALGPGIGTAPGTIEAVRKLVSGIAQPLVLDADGLNAMVGHTDTFRSRTGPLVVTPHPGEMARLAGTDAGRVQSDRINFAARFASEWEAVVVLKGAGTVIAEPGGDVFVNPTGNPGMATAGMGDVLTGCVASFIAQGLDAFGAAVAAAYFHGQAGDLAAQMEGMAGMTAGDVIRHLPLAIRRISEERWL
jgi:hydroxyethylthiazole kinase-like uncharacterized protein yjeF